MARRRGGKKKELIRVQLDLRKDDSACSIFWVITIRG